MGKWSFMNSNMSDNDAMFKMVNQLSDEEVDKTYLELRIKPQESFKLNNYIGSSGGGWACIDNSLHPDHEKTPVCYYCDYEEFRLGRYEYLEKCFKRATIMAVNLGLRNLVLNPMPEPVTASGIKSKPTYTLVELDDRGFADLVNSLTAIGQEFGTSQQLRARIADKLSTVICRKTEEV